MEYHRTYRNEVPYRPSLVSDKDWAKETERRNDDLQFEVSRDNKRFPGYTKAELQQEFARRRAIGWENLGY